MRRAERNSSARVFQTSIFLRYLNGIVELNERCRTVLLIFVWPQGARSPVWR